MKIWPGRPFPLGATWDGHGVNFAIYSEHATNVELCLFSDAQADIELERIHLPERTAYVWHGYVPEVQPGDLYAYRVHGPWRPREGHRFNENKLLIDPYARALAGGVDWTAPIFGHRPGPDPDADLVMDEEDDAWGKPLSVVVDPAFDWGDDAPPDVPWYRSVIYEAHVKGFTRRHPDVPPELRGTYAGLASPAAVAHLQRLGVTAIELQPIHAFVDEHKLVRRGLKNYWGYNTLGFFAPEARYASAHEPSGVVGECKAMVKALHAAGIEVILDVVYNHTAEGHHLGPTLSFRGIDNQSYYRLADGRPRYYVDYSGTGNSLNAGHPQVLKLIMDSLRYWVGELHVDGFRFDLASALARGLHEVDRLSAFFDIIHQDPVLSRVKLIAEPWDVGEGGYQVGNFPVLWTEWNGQYRDAVRRLWRGDPGRLGELAFRLTGSSDLYQDDGRRPYASINFVTCHDGFTLADLVSYEQKRNEANGENNRDGETNNLACNYGVEGPTDDPAIADLRWRQQRNFLATLAFSQGVPMLSHGDEIGRTQLGNNNAYCHDGELSWLDWRLDESQRHLLQFVQRIIQIRHEQPVLRRRHFFQGRHIRGSEAKDLTWLDPSGLEIHDEAWSTVASRAIGLLMVGSLINELDERGRGIVGDTLLLLLNPSGEAAPFTLPNVGLVADRWDVLVDTARPAIVPGSTIHDGGTIYDLVDRSLVLLRMLDGGPTGQPPQLREEGASDVDAPS
ncbi:MAG: glycogen debranching protein GlgX [Chloroflexi bacterium]|nr:glycogen debranching protein GlgX [Chloroflexota bacterium]